MILNFKSLINKFNVNIPEVDDFNILNVINKENEFLNKNVSDFNNDLILNNKNKEKTELLEFNTFEKELNKSPISLDDIINKNSAIKKNFFYNKELEKKYRSYLRISELENDFATLELRPYLISKINLFLKKLLLLRKLIIEKKLILSKKSYRFLSQKFEKWTIFYNSTYILNISLSKFNIEEKESISLYFYQCLLLMNNIVFEYYHNNYFLKNELFFFKNGNFVNEKENNNFYFSKKIKISNMDDYCIKDFKKINTTYFSNISTKKKISSYKLEEFLVFFQDLTNCQAILKCSSVKSYFKKKLELKYLISIINYYLTNFCFSENKDISFFFIDEKSDEAKIFLNFSENMYFINDLAFRYFSHFHYMINNIFFNIDKMYYFDNKKIYEIEQKDFFLKGNFEFNKYNSILETFLYGKIFDIISEYNIDGLNEFIKNFFVESIYSLILPGIENWFDFIKENTSMADYFLQKSVKEKKFLTLLEDIDSVSLSYIEILKGFFVFDLERRLLEKKRQEIMEKNKNKNKYEKQREEEEALDDNNIFNQKILEKDFLDDFFENKNLITFNESVTEEKFFILQFFYFVSFFGKETKFHYDKDRFNFNKKRLNENMNEIKFLKKIFLDKFIKKTDDKKNEKKSSKNFQKIFKIFLIFRNNLFLKFFDLIFQSYKINWFEYYVITGYDIYNYEILENKLMEKETPFIFQISPTDFFLLYNEKFYFSKDIIECILNWIIIVAFYKDYMIKYKNEQIYIYKILQEIIEKIIKSLKNDDYEKYKDKLFNMSKELKIENFFEDYDMSNKKKDLLLKKKRERQKQLNDKTNGNINMNILEVPEDFFDNGFDIIDEKDEQNNVDKNIKITNETHEVEADDEEEDEEIEIDESFKNVNIDDFNEIKLLPDHENKQFTKENLVFYGDEEEEVNENEKKEIKISEKNFLKKRKRNFFTEEKEKEILNKKDDSTNKLVQIYFK